MVILLFGGVFSSLERFRDFFSRSDILSVGTDMNAGTDMDVSTDMDAVLVWMGKHRWG